MKFDFELSWEFNTKEEIQARSIHAMRNHVDYVKSVSPFYENRLRDVDPDSVTDTEAIEGLPLTSIEDIKDNFQDFFAVHKRNFIEKVLIGIDKPNDHLFPLSKNDVDRLAFDSGLLLSGCNITYDDRAILLDSLDGGTFSSIAVYSGLNVVGAEVFRYGSSTSSNPADLMNALKPTVFAGTSKRLEEFRDILEKRGLTLDDLKIEKIVCICDSYSSTNDAQRDNLKNLFNAEVFSYHLMPFAQTAFCECENHTGLHSHPELLYAEVLDQDGSKTSPGEKGELVVTPFGTEGFVGLRLRTGLETVVQTEECSCRRNSLHLKDLYKGSGAEDFYIDINGETINAGILIDLLESEESMEDYSVIIEDGDGDSSLISIHGIIKPGDIASLSQKIMEKVGIPVPILVTNKATLNHLKAGSEGKIFDNRSNEAGS